MIVKGPDAMTKTIPKDDNGPWGNQWEKEIDHSKFDERFVNLPKKLDSGYDELELKKLEYLQQNARTWKAEPVEIPYIADLTPIKHARIPNTRNWNRRFSSTERNGFLNMVGPRGFYRIRLWVFLPFLVWGTIGHVFHNLYIQRFDHFHDKNQTVYEKFAIRRAAPFRVWARPG